MNRRRLISIGVGVGSVVALAWLLTSLGHSQPTGTLGVRPEGRLTKVVRGDLRLGVRTTGTLQPKNYVPVPSNVSAKIEWMIDEGTRVKKGDAVARCEDVEYRDALENAELNLSIQNADLARSKLTQDNAERSGKRDIEIARINLDLAQIELAELGEPEETTVKLSQLTLERARLELTASERDAERLSGLAAKGIVDQRQIALAELKREGARVAHAKAEMDHKQLLAGTPAEDIAVATQKVKRAETAMELVLKKYQRDVNLAQTATAVVAGDVDRYQNIIDTQRRQLESVKVIAPRDGTVIYPRPHGSPPLVGDQVWHGTRLIDIADPDAMVVEALVNQADWPMVQVGQDVEVTLVAAPDKRFTGKVVELGGLASDRYLTVGGDVTGVMTFRVVVQVNESDPLLRPTYGAYLNIITEEHKNVLYVSKTAVDSDNEGNPIVWVNQGGRTLSRRVKPGAQDAVNAIITEGLKEGEVVVVPRRK